MKRYIKAPTTTQILSTIGMILIISWSNWQTALGIFLCMIASVTFHQDNPPKK